VSGLGWHHTLFGGKLRPCIATAEETTTIRYTNNTFSRCCVVL